MIQKQMIMMVVLQNQETIKMGQIGLLLLMDSKDKKVNLQDLTETHNLIAEINFRNLDGKSNLIQIMPPQNLMKTVNPLLLLLFLSPSLKRNKRAIPNLIIKMTMMIMKILRFKSQYLEN